MRYIDKLKCTHLRKWISCSFSWWTKVQRDANNPKPYFILLSTNDIASLLNTPKTQQTHVFGYSIWDLTLGSYFKKRINCKFKLTKDTPFNINDFLNCFDLGNGNTDQYKKIDGLFKLDDREIVDVKKRNKQIRVKCAIAS